MIKRLRFLYPASPSMNLPTMDIPGMPGSQMGMINLGDVFGKNFGKQKKNEKNDSQGFSYIILSRGRDRKIIRSR
jgi:ATP-dependent HslUV protease ATP-binding subunit HslU